MGCTVGQGITGVFDLWRSARIVTFLAIVTSAAATLKFQYSRLMRRGSSAVALLQPGDDQRKGPGAPWHYLL